MNTIMKIRNLRIVGSSHIALQSIKEVSKAIREEEPDVIALELDRKRMHGLLQKKKGFDIRMFKQVGFKGALFALVGGWASNVLGRQVNVEPGSEMITALRIAKKEKILVALIDRNIELTLKDLSKSISWKEKWNLLVDMLKGVFGKGIDLDLTKVPEKKVISKLLSKTRERYPNIYNVLLTKRNKHMARNLTQLMKSYERVLAIVGAGHVEGIVKELNQILKSQAF